VARTRYNIGAIARVNHPIDIAFLDIHSIIVAGHNRGQVAIVIASCGTSSDLDIYICWGGGVRSSC